MRLSAEKIEAIKQGGRTLFRVSSGDVAVRFAKLQDAITL